MFEAAIVQKDLPPVPSKKRSSLDHGFQMFPRHTNRIPETTEIKRNQIGPTGLSYSSFHPFLPLRSGHIELPHAARQPGNKKVLRIFSRICLQTQQPTMIQRQASKNTEVRYCKTPTAP